MMQVLWAAADTFQLDTERTIEVHDLEVRYTLQPDETIGFADWYVDEIEVYGAAADGRYRYHILPKSHPRWQSLARLAVTDEKLNARCNEVWSRYLADLPADRGKVLVA
jgi:hypothetical protein